MHARDQRTIVAYRGVVAFLASHKADVGALNDSTARLILSEALGLINDTHVARASAAFQLTAIQNEVQSLRTELRLSVMRPAIVIGRTRLDFIPALAALKLPHANASTQTLINAAHDLADVVSLHVEAFAGESLPETTADRIRSRANALDDAVNRLRLLRTRNVERTAALEHEMRRARVALAILDARIEAGFRENRILIAKWRSVRRSA